MKTGQRYGKTQLIEDIRKDLHSQGCSISVRNARLFVESFLSCALNGLAQNGNLAIDKLGSFSIERNRRATLRTDYPLRIKYRATGKVREMLKRVWSGR